MSSIVHGLLAASLAFVVAGCDGGDEIPAETASAQALAVPRRPALDTVREASRLTTINFLSLRNRTGIDIPAETFGDERDVIHAGRCKVSFTPIRILDNIAKNAPLYIPSDDREIVAVDDVAMQTFWNDFVTVNTGARPLLYVHGYNVGFDKGCYRAARFVENLELGSRLLYFSWPSDGSALNYTRDEADLFWSVKALREVISRMEILFGRGQFDILGHSLGARGAALALSSMQGNHPASEPLVDKLILVAADIDADIFEQLLPRLRSQARHITSYVSDNDSALALSRELHGYPRLGEASRHVVSMDGVEFIDVSRLPLRRVSGHLYHLYNQSAYSDIDELINARRDAASRRGLSLADPTVPNFWRLPSPPER